MNSIQEIIKNRTFSSEVLYKNRRDEIVSKMTEEINSLREKAGYKPLTKKFIAIRANKNPFLKDDGELEYVYKECMRKGNFSHFFWITK